MRPLSRFLLASMALLATSIPAQAAYATLSLQSDSGDFIGQGGTYNITYTPDNSYYFIGRIESYVSGQPALLEFLMGTPGIGQAFPFSGLNFGTNKLGVPLTVGTYTDAQRASFAATGHPGLDVTFDHRGSNTLTGSFTVNEVSYYTDGNGDTQILKFDVNFEQHSEGKTPALRGHFVYNATGDPVPTPAPAGLLLLLAGAPVAALFRRRLFV
jgi:hypothetical protein